MSGNKQHILDSDLEMLDDYVLCQRMNCLPQSGGLYDQDWDIVKKFTIITEALIKKEQVEKEQEERTTRLRKLAEGQ